MIHGFTTGCHCGRRLGKLLQVALYLNGAGLDWERVGRFAGGGTRNGIGGPAANAMGEVPCWSGGQGECRVGANLDLACGTHGKVGREDPALRGAALVLFDITGTHKRDASRFRIVSPRMRPIPPCWLSCARASKAHSPSRQATLRVSRRVGDPPPSWISRWPVMSITRPLERASTSHQSLRD